MSFDVVHRKTVLRTHPFAVQQLHLERDHAPSSHPYYRLLCPDWVNVLPVLPGGQQALLVRQKRAGSLTFVLETPGGVVESYEEKDPTLTAQRELLEETGLLSQRLLSLGSVNPNPALQNNRLHCFLALDCCFSQSHVLPKDPEERIEVVPVATKELESLVRLGRVDHALSALCILLALKHLSF